MAGEERGERTSLDNNTAQISPGLFCHGLLRGLWRLCVYRISGAISCFLPLTIFYVILVERLSFPFASFVRSLVATFLATFFFLFDKFEKVFRTIGENNKMMVHRGQEHRLYFARGAKGAPTLPTSSSVIILVVRPLNMQIRNVTRDTTEISAFKYTVTHPSGSR